MNLKQTGSYEDFAFELLNGQEMFAKDMEDENNPGYVKIEAFTGLVLFKGINKKMFEFKLRELKSTFKNARITGILEISRSLQEYSNSIQQIDPEFIDPGATLGLVASAKFDKLSTTKKAVINVAPTGPKPKFCSQCSVTFEAGMNRKGIWNPLCKLCFGNNKDSKKRSNYKGKKDLKTIKTPEIISELDKGKKIFSYLIFIYGLVLVFNFLIYSVSQVFLNADQDW